MTYRTEKFIGDSLVVDFKKSLHLLNAAGCGNFCSESFAVVEMEKRKPKL